MSFWLACHHTIGPEMWKHGDLLQPKQALWGWHSRLPELARFVIH